MNSKEIKTELLKYWRFEREFILCATEAGRYEADVLISNGKQILEMEVKVSRSDLRNDFKKDKHRIYANKRAYCIPNKFYFAVPSNLVDEALELTKDLKYGVIAVQKGCKIVKKASLIKEEYSYKLERQIIMRMGSELIRARLKADFVEENKIAKLLNQWLSKRKIPSNKYNQFMWDEYERYL